MSAEEVRAAVAELQEAINVFIEKVDPSKGYLIDWLLITAEHHVDDDGSATSISMASSLEQSVYRTAGLIAYADQKIKNRMARG